MPGDSSFAHQSLPLSEPYPQKPYMVYSDDRSDGQPAPPMPLPHTDFDPYYSEFSNFDSDLDHAFVDVQDLSISHPPSYVIPATDPGPFYPAARLSQFAMGFPSDPPEMPDADGPQSQHELDDQEESDQPTFGDLPSSPPGSPQKPPVIRSSLAPPPLPQQMPMSLPRPNLDMLGISHPYGHQPRASISRIIPNSSSTHHAYLSGPGSGTHTASMPPTMRSPYAPFPSTPISPAALNRNRQVNLDSLPVYEPMSMPPGPLHSGSHTAPEQLHSMPSMPNLSPALSDASSVSPDMGSPDGVDDGFSWQPILTAPRSEQSEAIIEQQRKPKQKRRSCLPDGVVEEYVGGTEYEGVYMCLYPNCQRLFKRTYNLRSHIQTHLCDRPYICKVCHSNFVRPHDLRRHERCHSSDKPFECPCGKRFNRQDALQRHRLREICEGAIHSGIPKSPKPRGRPKGRKNTPTTSPDLAEDTKEHS